MELNDALDLVIVAGHALLTVDYDPKVTVDLPGRFRLAGVADVEEDSHWFLQKPFQVGEPPFYVEHVRRGVVLARHDEAAMLVFSGGKTRRVGERTVDQVWSEGASCLAVARHRDWWSATGVAERTVLEEYARDSFENLLFGLCRFHEETGRWPRLVTVVSWAFKAARFDLHRAALRFPAHRFRFDGFNLPLDLPGALSGERAAIRSFIDDPFGQKGDLAAKRDVRNPYDCQHPYGPLVTLLAGSPEALPWED